MGRVIVASVAASATVAGEGGDILGKETLVPLASGEAP